MSASIIGTITRMVATGGSPATDPGVYAVGAIFKRNHYDFGGASITGVVKIMGVPAVRRVLALDAKTHVIRAETWSNDSGAFTFEDLSPGGLYLILANDYTLEYNDVVAARIEAALQ